MAHMQSTYSKPSKDCKNELKKNPAWWINKINFFENKDFSKKHDKFKSKRNNQE